MATEPHMVFLGFGKYARSDRIFAIEPIRGEDRGDGRRTLVWVEGIGNPIVASRTERTILGDMGQERAAQSFIVDEALDLAERLAHAAEEGRVDLGISVGGPGTCSRRRPRRARTTPGQPLSSR